MAGAGQVEKGLAMNQLVGGRASTVSALLTLHALVCVGSSTARTIKEPVRITHEGSSLIVTLAPALRQAISRHFPGYHLPSITAFYPGLRKDFLMAPPPGELPASFICVGDFDGNGLPD